MENSKYTGLPHSTTQHSIWQFDNSAALDYPTTPNQLQL